MASSKVVQQYWRSLARPGLGRRGPAGTALQVEALTNTSLVNQRNSTSSSSPTEPKRERVVVLGSGWAGYAFARDLDPKKYERILISPRSYFVFTPLLASTSVGTLEFRSVLEPVRRLELDSFHQAWADDVDFTRKVIRIEKVTSEDATSKTLPARDVHSRAKGEVVDVAYDKLVVAVGSYSQTFGIEGVKEYANFLRDIGDARSIRLRVLQCFEKADWPTTTDEQRRKLLHFAVVGGGPTGIEFAAELHDLIHDDLSKLYPHLMEFVGITVYDIAPKVLPMFDQQLASYAEDLFRRQGIKVKTNHHLQRIRSDEADPRGALRLKIQEHGEEEVGAGIVVWSTGLMQNPLVQTLMKKELRNPNAVVAAAADGEGQSASGGEMVNILRAERSGGIVTDEHLRVRLDDPKNEGAVLPDVYSMGDCSVLEGQTLPATAQVASQQAKYLAKALNKAAAGPEGKPFKFRNLGAMAYLGSWRAIHQSSADELKGRAAWILWRCAYLTKSMSVRNKILVPVYWFITWVFGRDISRF
ncbi:pyridine nucleotide-disulfide oxidoreductase-domain-containing protein [Colletotrichum phormii]|uniref:Pyridine nucleotide-disulfide oxidoreductase-domain-containing protein n=1 Tax=Colletotrichum phormii TaxID=359342 RepID=A0AAJ0A1G0_9PEZI|nr:pyridine nucleotide-disulfide oxidoreductase-domain-containing protein [Colletotrichum phormii]KAK1640367.1 pyridine nucleotide-disulfide oxidoreductase-domain-containing protein [Colletotrichum phormii]